jgi:hypothetical protein
MKVQLLNKDKFLADYNSKADSVRSPSDTSSLNTNHIPIVYITSDSGKSIQRGAQEGFDSISDQTDSTSFLDQTVGKQGFTNLE